MSAVRRLTVNPERAQPLTVVGDGQVSALRAQVAALAKAVAAHEQAVARLEDVLARQGAAMKIMRRRLRDLDGIEASLPQPAPAADLVMQGGTVRQIAEDVATGHGLTLRDILGSARVRPVTVARQEVMYRASLTGLSLARIGRALGRDHTTVMSGIAAHKRRAGIE